ncbi:CheR family methyltransferase [Rubrivirga sp. IMCC45206]|uniref:CheR family methyltransferase n=1 Tax=Rubrivirga sp. IMCC45206 TaxID=3391614 RepID=UPI00398FC1B2
MSAPPPDDDGDEVGPGAPHGSDIDGIAGEAPPGVDTFPVVGIGASAGGLRAFQEFFSALPAQPGMAFVLVQHLSPDHESALAELIQTRTQMTVAQVDDHPDVEANCVYVIPPGRHLEIEDGHLQLVEARRDRGRPAAIDHFFRTLAEDMGDRAVCVVLSGTGSDGSLGLKAVKERGGLAMAQAPDDAEYDGMPGSALATELVDVQGTAAELAEKLVAIRNASNRLTVPAAPDDPLVEDDHQALQAIFAHLRERTAHDFSDYKRTTILRRLARRLQMTGQPGLPSYAAYLRSDPGEVQALLRDFLISVTQFFRDSEAFEALQAEVVPALFEGKGRHDQVRVWVAGCATGEEAYSIAMLLCEYKDRLADGPDIQVFATDIDDDALDRAREGVYSEIVAADVSAERLQRFFQVEGDAVRVKPEIRQMVLFARHNLLSDPPFSRLDLVACRNVLIYFNRSVQERVFATFHYALHPEGWLFLGAAEGPALLSKGFAAVDKPARIYQRRGGAAPPRLPFAGGGDGRKGAAPRARPADPPIEGVVERYRDWTLDQYAPPRLLVDEHYDVTHVFGTAGDYLRDREGPVSQNVVDKVLRVLRVDLRAALFRAFSSGEPTDSRFHRVVVGGRERVVRLHVGRVGGAAAQDGQAEVVFIELDPETVASLGAVVAEAGDGDGLVDGRALAQLEQELHQTRKQLQQTMEEGEVATEELKASNEELQSINEELQSTTEELETSKEELQSTNEELRTVNQELKNKVDELLRSNADLQNLMASTDIATLFLDRELRLTRFTPRAADVFHVIPPDLGRPLDHLAHRLRSGGVVEVARRVLDTLVPEDWEVDADDGQHYRARVLPYRTPDDRIDGVVLTFVDVTALKDALDEGERRARQQAAVAALGVAALDGTPLDELFALAAASAAKILDADFAKVLRHRPEHGDLILEAGVGWADGLVGVGTVPDNVGSQAGFTLLAVAPVVVPDLAAETRFTGPPLLHDHGVQSGVSVPIHGANGAWGVLGVHSRVARSFADDDAQAVQSLANVVADAIRRAADERTIDEQLAEIEAIYGTAPVGLAYMDQELRYRRINTRLAEINGLPVEEHIGRQGSELFPLLADVVEPILLEILETGQAVEDVEFQGATLRDPDDLRDWLSSYVPDVGADGAIHGVSVVVRDITDRKRAEADRVAALADLDFVLDSVEVGVWSMDVATEAYRLDDRTLQITRLSLPLLFEDAMDRVHPDDRAEITTQLQAAMSGGPDGPAYVFNVRLRGDDDIVRWIEVRGRFLPDQGAQGTLSGIVYDTTPLHEAREAARQRLSEIEAYFRSIPLVVSVLDLDGRYLRVNDEAVAFTGLPAEALIGQRAADLFPDHARLTDPLIASVVATGEPQLGVPVRAAAPSAPDVIRHWLLYVHPVVDEGAIVAVTVGAQDITDLRRAQDELRALTTDLEARVEARTEQVRGLAVELSRAEEAERERIADLLHDDLQQTLFGVQVQTKLLADALGDADGPAAELLGQARTMLAQAIHSARTLSAEFSPPVASDEGFTASLTWLAHRVEEAHGLRVAVEGPDDLVVGPDLRVLLLRSLRELLFNVAKHAAVDRATIQLSEADGEVRVEVIDEGAGFDPSEADRVRRGLGLESIRRRLSLAGGRIEVTSTPGAGTRVALAAPSAA